MRQCQLIVERKSWKLFRINQGNFVAADGILGFDFSQNSDVWITVSGIANLLQCWIIFFNARFS